MGNQDFTNVVYSYSYFEENNNMDSALFSPKIFDKLPRIGLSLPKIAIIENLELSFC